MEYQVWIEGFACTGQSQGAQYLGTEYANTFPEACVKAIKNHNWDMSYYNEDYNDYWGCSFFESGSDAVKSFG